MAIFCNYNIPIFPMQFGALTFGTCGWRMPMTMPMPMPMFSCCNTFYAPPPIVSTGINPFISNPFLNCYSRPVFNFDNINNTSVTGGTTSCTNYSAQTNGWFNNFQLMPSFNLQGMRFDFSNLLTSNIGSNLSLGSSSGSSPGSSSEIGDTFTRSTTGTITSIKTSGGKIIPKEYNSEKGIKFANAVLKQAGGRTKGGGQCSKKVRMAMQEVGLYTSHPEHAADFIPILEKNPHFKRLNVSNINVRELPAGCILVYGRGVGGYSSVSGHIEVTTGDGRAASDFVHEVYKKPTAIFVPV